MATAVETLDKLERRITITLPLADVQAEVEKQLKVRARSAKAPGFRPGKVPMKMVAQQYGYQVESDVLNERVGRAFAAAAARKTSSSVALGFPMSRFSRMVPLNSCASCVTKPMRSRKRSRSTSSLGTPL